MAHKTIPVMLNTMELAWVDEGIAPVVSWLNSFPSVSTLYSCQGGEEHHRKPYILFQCYKQSDLKKILKSLRIPVCEKLDFDFAPAYCKVDYVPDLSKYLRYQLVFGTCKSLKLFIQFLENPGMKVTLSMLG